jgi:hypothetical protein
MNMRKPFSLISVAAGVLLVACDQTPPAADIDPGLGLACFERQRPALPPGTQYEGIEDHSGDRLRIRIMNGVDVVTIECGLNPDGSLQTATP